MCFSYDSCTMCEVSEYEQVLITEQRRCCECQRLQAVGSSMIYCRLQEYEECQTCLDGECQCPNDDCCQCDDPQYGEEFVSYRCMDCNTFLNAVQVSEEEAGCDYLEARPLHSEMIESCQGEWERYVDKARELYPHLIDNGYLDWLVTTCFDRKRES